MAWPAATPAQNRRLWRSGTRARTRRIDAGHHPQRARALRNEAVEIEGVRIWGASAASLYFTPSEGAQSYTAELANIPAQIDVLVTHAPPLGILDSAHRNGDHEGHPVLGRAVRRIRPQVHAFSHILGAYGIKKLGDTMFVNAALPAVGGTAGYEPIVLEITRRPQ